METDFIKEANSKMKKAIPVHSSKMSDQIPKIAVALHVLEQMFDIIIDEEKTTLSEEVSLQSLIHARNLINHSEDQKSVLKEVLLFL